MQMKGTIRFALAAAMLLPAASPVLAQVAPYGEKTMGDPAQDHLPDILNTVKIDQRLGQQLPLDASFRDETGKAVKLGDYFGKKPGDPFAGLLPMPDLVLGRSEWLGRRTRDGEPDAGQRLRDRHREYRSQRKLRLWPRPRRPMYVKRYGRPGHANGWHFLTGGSLRSRRWPRQSVLAMCVCPQPDGKPPMFAHASSIEVVTPEGRMAQYYMGVEYSPRGSAAGPGRSVTQHHRHAGRQYLDLLLPLRSEVEPAQPGHCPDRAAGLPADCSWAWAASWW